MEFGRTRTNGTQVTESEVVLLEQLEPGDLSQLQSLPHNCFQDATESTIENGSLSLFCPATFDGWSCWNKTAAGDLAVQPCPAFVPGFDSLRFAHKVCNFDGAWYRHPDTNKTWSNYTTCVDNEDLQFRQSINNLYIIGYSLSVSALLFSLFIFLTFRSLRCTRISIHKNLFISFIINNVMWIIWYTTVVKRTDVLVRSAPACLTLHVLVQYSLVSNYLWMFCEGFYLHTVLVIAFVKEDRLIRWMYVIGWGLSGVLTVVYAGTRGLMDPEPTFCWIEETPTRWILSGPVCLSMLLNFFFLINIVRVLVTKLRAVNSAESNHTRKAVRATLILIPLLGLHYVMTPFRPEPRSPGEALYETVAALVTSFQGFCVAVLFCFFNGEVLSLLKRKWRQSRMVRHEDLRSSKVLATTVIWDVDNTTI